MADGPDFAQHVGDRQEAGASRKQIALEIGAKPVTHHRDAKPVGDVGKLPDLRVGQELRLVDHDTGKAGLSLFGLDQACHVSFAVKDKGRSFKPDTRSDASFGNPVVKPRGQQHRVHASFAVVMRGLQQYGGFAGVHRGVGKIKLGHGAPQIIVAMMPPGAKIVNGKNRPGALVLAC